MHWGDYRHIRSDSKSGRAERFAMPSGEACDNIKIAKEEGLTCITLNRPEKRDAMSPKLDRARKLMAHNPETLRAAKQAMKLVRGMNMDPASVYLLAKDAQLRLSDRERGYVEGIKQFIDDKSYRPGLGRIRAIRADPRNCDRT
jgi:enoyl-CoA hydratase/carnithine racemase